MPWDFWLILIFLGVVVPWRGAVRMKRLLAKEETTTRERLSLYGSTIAMQWSMALLTGWRAVARGLSWTELGLSGGRWLGILVACVVGGAVIGALHWRNLSKLAGRAGPGAARMKTIAKHILPQTPIELLFYCGLSVTAGVCEEFLYRGFAYGVALHYGLGNWAAVIMSSVLFGFAHLYQGRGGVMGTSILGGLFGAARWFTGSLLPPMAWHSVVDVVAGIAGPRFLLARTTLD